MPQPHPGPVSANAQGRIFLWYDHWQLVGHLLPNKTHQHISASLLVGLQGAFRLECEGEWRTTRAALVAPDVPQALDPAGTAIWAVQLDPDSVYWLSLRHLLGAKSSVDLELAERYQLEPDTASCDSMKGLLSGLISDCGAAAATVDQRVLSCSRHLRDTMPDKLDLGALAASVHLSGSRLTHLFRSELGVSPRRFLLHLKMNRALAYWEPGKTVSQLAVEAGFYDQPHLVRTARGMFDALPSAYVAGDGFQLCRCGLER